MPWAMGADACINLRRTEGLHERGGSINVRRLDSRGIMGQWFVPSVLKCHETGAILCHRPGWELTDASKGASWTFRVRGEGRGNESGLVHFQCERYEILSCEIDLCDKIKDRAMTKQK